MKFSIALILALLSTSTSAKSDWTKYVQCPKLIAKYKSDLIEIETLETVKGIQVIDACIYLDGGDCFKLIERETVNVSSGYDFKVSSIEIQMENYYDRVCTYPVQDI